MAFDLLKLLGISRYRIYGFSVFNFLGTFLFTFILSKIIIYTWLQLNCIVFPLAVFIHYIRNEQTPLVKFVFQSKENIGLTILIFCYGISGNITLLNLLYGYISGYIVGSILSFYVRMILLKN